MAQAMRATITGIPSPYPAERADFFAERADSSEADANSSAVDADSSAVDADRVTRGLPFFNVADKSRDGVSAGLQPTHQS